MKYFIIIGICIIFCISMFGCGLSSDNVNSDEPNATDNASPVTSERTAVDFQNLSYDEFLTAFTAIKTDDVKKIDLVYSGEHDVPYYKTFTSSEDIAKILTALFSAEPTATEPIEPSNGWNFLIEIWLKNSGSPTEIERAILISPYGNEYISINNNIYLIKNNSYESELIEFYNSSDIQEIKY